MSPTSDPVLLLHGQPGGARDWDGVRAALAGRMQTIAIDRPGWGTSGGGPSDLEGNARAVLAALDARGIERAIVVGHSLGGTVATWLAVVAPSRVGALVLAAPAANLASLYRLDYWLASRPVGSFAGAVAMSGVGLWLGVAPLRRGLAERGGLDESYLRDAGRRLLSPSAWRAYTSDQRLLVRELPALEARLGRVAAVTTVVCGTADRVVPVDSARVLARQIPGARLELIEGAGHLLPQRHAGRLAALILEAGTRGPADQ